VRTQQTGEDPYGGDIKEADEGFEEKRCGGYKSGQPKEKHCKGGIACGGIFVVNTMPDFVGQWLEDGITGGMDVRVEAVIQYVTLPDVTVHIVGRWKGEKCQTDDDGQGKDKDQLPSRGPVSGKSPEKPDQKEKGNEIEATKGEEIFPQGAEECHGEGRREISYGACVKGISRIPLCRHRDRLF
jgi:hypothetical protein